jgi:ribonuclease D
LIAALLVVNAGSVPVANLEYGQIASTNPVRKEETLAIDTEAAVRQYFSDIPVMIQVARCESTFRHTLADGTVLKGAVDGRDTGVMQINTGFHAATAKSMGLDLTILHDNMAYARHLYETQGTSPWSASRSCWGNTLALR